MPKARAGAMTQDELFGQTGIVTKTTEQRALKELLKAGLIQRIGKGCKGSPLRYFLENVPGAGIARDLEVSLRSRMRIE
jgi:predicted transcriptional regulator